jgi:hypothetical protein
VPSDWLSLARLRRCAIHGILGHGPWYAGRFDQRRRRVREAQEGNSSRSFNSVTGVTARGITPRLIENAAESLCKASA